MTAYRIKVKIFTVLIGVLLLLQLRSMFFECNTYNLEHTGMQLFLMLGYLLVFLGFFVQKFKGYVIGAIFFTFYLAYQYIIAIIQVSSSGFASLDIHTLLYTTFVNLIFLFYVLSTKHVFFEYETDEPLSHKLLFILMILAFLAQCYIFYLGYIAELGLCVA